MTSGADIRARIVRTFRRDLVGPLPATVDPGDADLARERLNESPSRWYLVGYLAPADDAPEADDPAMAEERENQADLVGGASTGGAAGDDEPPEPAAARRRLLPSSIGITVLLPPEVTKIEARIDWGDYRTEPRLDAALFLPDETADDGISEGEGDGRPKRREKLPDVDWVRLPRTATLTLPVADDRRKIVVPDSAAEQRPGGALEIEMHGRLFDYAGPDGGRVRVRALTVFLVNRRAKVQRRYADVGFVFQARLELTCAEGFLPRHDVSTYGAAEEDLRIADLHYRDVAEYAVGRGTAAAWDEQPGAPVTRVWTDPLPLAEVERVAPNEEIRGVEFDMERLADLAAAGADPLAAAIEALPALYGSWIAAEAKRVGGFPQRRRETAAALVADMEAARGRIAEGIDLLRRNARARTAFAIMNRAVAMAARRRNAGPGGDPSAQKPPEWRPFQLAFVLLNLAGLADKTHADRERVDLLFFPTGGGKTEAYLGLAAFAIAHRRLANAGLLGAGVAVIMRYTLRLLTLDQLGRAAGVICALELLRLGPDYRDAKDRPLLGDWPIEIGLWVGSDASPNRMGGKGDTGDDTAVTRVRRFLDGKDKRAPAPIKACPWCGKAFAKQSFACMPNSLAPKNLELRCANPQCDFTGGRALPILTVDEPIYRRLPAFLIATVDKFASLPWVGESGAFFGHVDRHDEHGFYGAAAPREGRPLDNGWSLDPPDLIVQDELHLISGPLGTVAGLYEAAIDRLATRMVEGRRVRPKIVASTATVRRAEAQIAALFDRAETRVFPPPGIDRGDSFFAVTVPSTRQPARLYMGLAAQGRGPKLVFLRALTTLLAAAQAEFEAARAAGIGGDNPADPYMTALCYFNALRELGGARRIVEGEVTPAVRRYGSERRRVTPPDAPFRDRQIRMPMELTSRVSTDQVAQAKRALETAFADGAESVDVALATNMISVGLDILRLGLMIVQGQPKTAAEYIQATSRVGRNPRAPGLIVTVLNLHKPRDRTHYEQFAQFHRSFYRAVEATSVTPWAPRALDRSLAAIVVAAARHIDGAMTPENAATRLAQHPSVRAAVRDAIVARAPDSAVVGGHAELARLIDAVIDDWIAVADEQTAAGGRFAYSHQGAPHHLLHVPLDPALPNLAAQHRRFVAGRSMRDVEPNVHLKVLDPWGNPIAQADDVP
jgi:hypothetical protein